MVLMTPSTRNEGGGGEAPWQSIERGGGGIGHGQGNKEGREVRTTGEDRRIWDREAEGEKNENSLKNMRLGRETNWEIKRNKRERNGIKEVTERGKELYMSWRKEWRGSYERQRGGKRMEEELALKKENLRETRRTDRWEKRKISNFFFFFGIFNQLGCILHLSFIFNTTLLRHPPFRCHSFGRCCMGLNLGLFNSLTATVASAGSQTFLYTRLVFAHTWGFTRSRLDLTRSRLDITRSRLGITHCRLGITHIL